MLAQKSDSWVPYQKILIQRAGVELLYLPLKSCVACFVKQSCPTLCAPYDCSPPGSVHGLLQARVMGWVAISSPPGVFPTQGSKRASPCLLRWQVDSLRTPETPWEAKAVVMVTQITEFLPPTAFQEFGGWKIPLWGGRDSGRGRVISRSWKLTKHWQN